ncbi:MAG: hypothetical protein AB1483_00790 [Candidatus Zixiibacteriota bacterium]
MFSRFKRYLAFSIVTLMIFTSVVAGEDSPKGNIHPNFRLSFSERFRLVSWDNSVNLTDASESATSFTRHRTSIMGQYFALNQFELGLKLTNEFRHYFVPENTEFTWNEIFVDQLYGRWTKGRFALTVGRQDIKFGEGFVVLDGGPLDGSRSAYFNAARLDIKPCPQGTLSLFYLYQPRQEDYLPLINDQEKDLVEQDEEGFGAYLSRDVGKGNVQAYYIRKNIVAVDNQLTESGINTIGARITTPLTPQLSVTGEGAYEFGTYGNIDRKAMGGYAYADYNTGWMKYLPKKLTAGGVYLSGDDPETEDWEGWEPMLGRWPKWSESFIYTLVPEYGVAYWSNYASLFGRVEFEPMDRVNFRFEYQHLMAPQVAALSYMLHGDGNNRGEMLIGKLTYTINDYLSGHVVWEHFIAGDYYIDNTDPANWLRFQLMLAVQ